MHPDEWNLDTQSPLYFIAALSVTNGKLSLNIKKQVKFEELSILFISSHHIWHENNN